METAVLVGLAAVIAVLVGLIGVVVGRHTFPAIRGEDPAALHTAQLEAARLNERADSLQGQLRTETSRREAAEVEANSLRAEEARLKQREEDLSHQIKEMQNRLTTEFENIANRILRAKSSELSEQSQKELGSLLEPLRTQLLEFRNNIERTYQSETRDVLSLKAQVELLVTKSDAVGSHADDLAKALRGDSQVLGRWGDLKLERILEISGMAEGRDYVSQGRGLKLRNDEGGIQRPDIIVLLPEQKSMIVDSKVSLVNYERMIHSVDDRDKTAYRNQFVRDMRTHIDGLAGKRYQDNEKLKAHECVLMFVPIEAALCTAMTIAPDLFSYAWDRHVVLVAQSTLMITISTVASIWRWERQSQNAQEIARLAGNLIDKLNLSLEDLNLVADKLGDAVNAHNEAVKRLSTGRGNALSIGAEILRLGVKSKHGIPDMTIDGASIGLPDEDGEEIPVLLPGPRLPDRENGPRHHEAAEDDAIEARAAE